MFKRNKEFDDIVEKSVIMNKYKDSLPKKKFEIGDNTVTVALKYRDYMPFLLARRWEVECESFRYTSKTSSVSDSQLTTNRKLFLRKKSAIQYFLILEMKYFGEEKNG